MDDVRRAAMRIASVVRRTPVMTCAALDELAGCRVHLKCEHLQRTGSFKIRGATNAVRSLDEEQARRGVAAHSSGNHAAALAFAARDRGIPCRVVMPSNAPLTKREATAGYGAEIVLCEPTLEARESTLADVIDRTGATEVHPYDDPRVIAGQGTAALELLADVPHLGAIVAPVSGGGLLSGTVIAAHGTDGRITIVGAEPAAVDDARRSLAGGRRTSEGNGDSIADGLLAVLSDRTFGVIRDHEVAIETVTEDEIVEATWFVMERTKQVVEPSGATAVAALVAMGRRGAAPAGDVGVILSGGNVDLDRLPARPARSARW